MIDVLFYPGSIAVIGASKDPQKVGYAVLNDIIKYNFSGDVFPINPKPEEILGHMTYQGIGYINKEIVKNEFDIIRLMKEMEISL